MKLLAGLTLFLLCVLAGEGKSRRLQRRAQMLSKYHELIREISEKQLNGLLSFREGVLTCPPSPERNQLLCLLRGEVSNLHLLTTEEREGLCAYARSESRSAAALRGERDALLTMLQRKRDKTGEELAHKGQVYRSVGCLCGAAALLLVL